MVSDYVPQIAESRRIIGRQAPAAELPSYVTATAVHSRLIRVKTAFRERLMQRYEKLDYTSLSQKKKELEMPMTANM
eukprot:m.264676 g.264676  ORF g.264676 m.264676 type:complete len:77 (+) comp57525_c0_seq1:997-1227(+)